jgi:AraC-like DNA-binding protein
MLRKDVQLIREIREFIDAHLAVEHTIPTLCRQFSINREKLQAGFQAEVRLTVHAYIIDQRMKKAARRLIESDDAIKAISIDSGYKKQRSFNKTFKSIFHLTPATYRRVHQEKVNV